MLIIFMLINPGFINNFFLLQDSILNFGMPFLKIYALELEPFKQQQNKIHALLFIEQWRCLSLSKKNLGCQNVNCRISIQCGTM